MRVTQSPNPSIQSTQTSQSESAKKSEQTQKARSRSATEVYKDAAGTAAGSAKTDISAKGRELATARSVATSTPDVREDRVAELKKRIAEGKYEVDSNRIADKLVNEHMSF